MHPNWFRSVLAFITFPIYVHMYELYYSDLLEEPLLTVGDSCGDCGLLEVGLAAGDFCCCCCVRPAEVKLPLILTVADACNIQFDYYTYPL